MKKLFDRIFKSIFLIASAISILSFAFITIYLFTKGLPTIFTIGVSNFIFSGVWQPIAGYYGILFMIVGSIYVTLGAIAVGFPIGLFTAIFLSEVAPKKISTLLRPIVQLLAGIPSVVFGFFGLTVIVPKIESISGAGNSLLAAVIVLGFMILPTVITLSESAIAAVPKEYREGSYALGETKIFTIFRVVLPAAKSGILTSLILGAGRAIGEATAVILVAGNTVKIPKSIFDPVRTLTANSVFEMGYATGLHYDALLATGVVLFILIMCFNLALLIINRKVAEN